MFKEREMRNLQKQFLSMSKFTLDIKHIYEFLDALSVLGKHIQPLKIKTCVRTDLLTSHSVELSGLGI